MPPRNPVAYAEGRELHSYVRDLVRLLRCTCPHCRLPPAAKVVRNHLPERFQHRSLKTISSHIRAVVAELDAEEEIGESCGTVSFE